MLTVSDVYKQVRKDNPLYEDFVKEYVLPKFQLTFGKHIEVYYYEISPRYEVILNNYSLLKENLESRGFSVETDQQDGKRFMTIVIPPQGDK